MNEKQVTTSLKMVNKTMGDILTKSYGMKEDQTHVVPLKSSRGIVRMLELSERQRTYTETYDEHRDYYCIRTCQKTTYQHLMTKKRNREYETDERQHKKKKKEEQIRSRQRHTALSTASCVSLEDLHNDMNKSEDGDGFDENEPDLS